MDGWYAPGSGSLERPGCRSIRDDQGHPRTYDGIVEQRLEVGPGTGSKYGYASIHRAAPYERPIDAVNPAESRAVGAEAPSTARETCRTHPERLAVERCAACGRTACLSCAVPVRGRVLCIECATREVGMPAPAAAPEPRRLFKAGHAVAAALFGTGVLATIAPWDRFGILTTKLSAWRPDNPWPLVASISLLVGASAALAFLFQRMSRVSRFSAGAYTILALVAGTATIVELLGAPDYVVPSPAPYVILTASVAILGLGIVMLLRRFP